MDSQQNQRLIFSVSQLNRRARQLLETHLSLIWVRGELSNLTRPSSGHWYFTLKDRDAQVRCAMFRNRNQRVTFRPVDGQQVVVRGRVSLYENRGDYQVLVEHLEADGVGLLQQKFEELKNRLAAEGLFDQTRKKALPPFPRHIGVVTSPSGAAIRDIMHVLQRRMPMVPITLYASAVQGQGAAADLVAALAEANRRKACDLLIVGRGGGGIEDLWPFNEESVARAIAASRIPIISAVGHEADFTIADFVADVRAATPSAAAEIATPDRKQLLENLVRAWARLVRDQEQLLGGKRQRLEGLAKRLRNPSDRLREQSQRLDHLEFRLHRAGTLTVEGYRHRLRLAQKRLQVDNPARAMGALNQRLLSLSDRLEKVVHEKLTGLRLQLVRQSSILEAVSPLGTLRRGYAIPRLDRADNQPGGILRTVRDVGVDARLTLLLADGRLACTVNDISDTSPLPLADSEDHASKT